MPMTRVPQPQAAGEPLYWDDARKMYYKLDPATGQLVFIHPNTFAAPPPVFVVPLGPPTTVVLNYDGVNKLPGRSDVGAMATYVGSEFIIRHQQALQQQQQQQEVMQPRQLQQHHVMIL
ncbi:hypothetical protein HDU96_006460 [Phlyctochytrium bullatum]|nr:hypothetical protein HDU96_006460 [Phlyctochytrium bullatum]